MRIMFRTVIGSSAESADDSSVLSGCSACLRVSLSPLREAFAKSEAEVKEKIINVID